MDSKFLDQIDHLQQGDRQADCNVIHAVGMEKSPCLRRSPKLTRGVLT
jgi:hypothetical protein